MWHPFPGFSGAVTSAAVCATLWASLRGTKTFAAYNIGPDGNAQAYDPLMTRYIRLAEFMVGAASGSIVLVVGSSALHGNGGRLAWFYASPLLLIAASVVYGIGFMACLILNFENALHGNRHTANRYTLSETLGFSALLCFVIGYIWLVIATTNL